MVKNCCVNRNPLGFLLLFVEHLKPSE